MRIEFLVQGWKKNELSLSIDNKVTAFPNPPKEKTGQVVSIEEIDVQVLGEQLDTTKTSAKLEQGVLTVTIPVSAKAKAESLKSVEKNLTVYPLFMGKDFSTNGAGGGIRTHDPRFRRPMLYPAELLRNNYPNKYMYSFGQCQSHAKKSLLFKVFCKRLSS